MPEWLLNKDDYEPQKDNRNYIEKSLLSIMKALSKIRFDAFIKDNRFLLNPLVKILWALLFILLVSMSRSLLFISFAGTFLLVLLSFLNLRQIKHVAKTSIAAAAFTTVILIPSIIMGNGTNSILMIVRVAFSVSSVSLISCTTQWSEITGALKVLFIPDIFILVFDITVKYIVILGELATDMLHSLKLRSIGISKDKNTALSGIMGTIFIKSREMAEDMYGAMECRGFTGEYRAHGKQKFKLKDLLFIMANVILILAFIYI